MKILVGGLKFKDPRNEILGYHIIQEREKKDLIVTDIDEYYDKLYRLRIPDG